MKENKWIYWWLNLINAGFTVDMFTADRPQPRWSTCSRDCPHVQDRQDQIWDSGKKLDSEICHELIELCSLAHPMLIVCAVAVCVNSNSPPVFLKSGFALL